MAYTLKDDDDDISKNSYSDPFSDEDWKSTSKRTLQNNDI
jgi:hypothetical protein